MQPHSRPTSPRSSVAGAVTALPNFAAGQTQGRECADGVERATADGEYAMKGGPRASVASSHRLVAVKRQPRTQHAEQVEKAAPRSTGQHSDAVGRMPCSCGMGVSLA